MHSQRPSLRRRPQSILFSLTFFPVLYHYQFTIVDFVESLLILWIYEEIVCALGKM